LAFIGIMTVEGILMNGSGTESSIPGVGSAYLRRFITALKGPDEEVARDFLSRIAAKVVPIMKKHGMDVMSLEEFEPNREFVGRYTPIPFGCDPGLSTWVGIGMLERM
jgi:hypothetical protein